jgi:hypothetical protein
LLIGVRLFPSNCTIKEYVGLKAMPKLRGLSCINYRLTTKFFTKYDLDTSMAMISQRLTVEIGAFKGLYMPK